MYAVMTPRRKKDRQFVSKFLLCESALAICFVVIGRYWVYASPFVWATQLHVSVPVAKALILGSLFGLPGVALRFILPWREAREKIDSHSPRLDRVASLGIIDFSWLLQLSLGIILVWVLATTPPLCNPLPPPGLSPDYYKEYRADASEIFTQCVLMLTAVMTGLSVCMTILWTGGKWRQSVSAEGRRDYDTDVRSAMKMVAACFVFVISFLVWVLAPLYERMNGVLERLK